MMEASHDWPARQPSATAARLPCNRHVIDAHGDYIHICKKHTVSTRVKSRSQRL